MVFAAQGAAAALGIAVYALHSIKGFAGLWNTGGYEYPIFWSIPRITVALNEFNSRPLHD